MNLIILIFPFLSFQSEHFGINDTIPKIFNSGEKFFCCSYCDAKYDVTKNGNKITIVFINKGSRKTVHGVILNGKIFSDDPEEKENKSLAGKLYVLKADSFLVRNPENGESDYYKECK